MIYATGASVRPGASGSVGLGLASPPVMEMDGASRRTWADEELGAVDLGHAARDACARDVLAGMALARGTRVTDFAEDSAERQQAYGFIENDKVDPEALTAAAGQAALGRLDEDAPWCIVPTDGSSLKLADEFGKKGFGRVGGQDSTRGLLVQTAMAVSTAGVPLGIVAQKYWARSLTKSPKGKAGKSRQIEDKETKYWLDVVRATEDAGVEAGVQGRLWFQLDRGYDSSAMLECMATSLNRFTIRGQYNRALWADDAEADDADVDHHYVQDALDAAPICSVLSLEVEASQSRAARMARMELQVAEVTVRVSDPSRRMTVRGADGTKQRVAVRWPRTLSIVRVREVGTTPEGEEPLQWMLWVNFPVASDEEAELVVRMYALRWRIEEFHRMWKSGAMKVEQTQARSGDHVERIVRLSALVACRLLRLTRLARTNPDIDASTEFSRVELAVLRHTDPRSSKRAPRPETSGSLAWAIAVIADIGGYTGRSSGGPPGPLVLARGMQRMIDRADGFAAALQIRDQW